MPRLRPHHDEMGGSAPTTAIRPYRGSPPRGDDLAQEAIPRGGGPMFLFILLPVLVVLGMVLIAGPALLPLALIAVVAVLVSRAVTRHRHPDHAPHPH